MYELNPSLKQFWRHRKPYKILKGGRFCHAVGEKVVMFDGSVRAVEDVQEGDLLMGPDSLPRVVKEIHRGFDDLYTVKQAGGQNYTVNSSHILALKRAKNAGKGKPLVGGGHSVRYDLGDTATMNVVDFMNSSGKFKTVYRGYKAQGVRFQHHAELKLDPYFMGLWLGDGMSDSATITTMDQEIVDYVKSYAQSLGLTVKKRENKNNRSSNYHMVCESRKNVITRELRRLGVFTMLKNVDGERRRVKAQKRIPKDYLLSSAEDRLKVLAGLVDSDGMLDQKKNVVVISSAREGLAKDIKFLVDSLGFKSTITKRAVKCQNDYDGVAWVISFSGKLSSIPTLIERKQATKDSTRGVGLCGLSVESAGYGEYVGFTVDRDHLYLLEDFTVLHNSGKTHDAGGMAAFLARNYSLRFLCIRQFQNRITESVYTVIKQKIEAAGWTDEFDILNTTIRHKTTGSEFLFYGMARNIAEIKGTEGVDICWIEEGEGLTEEQWMIIDPTMRKEGCETWILYNPRLMTDFIEMKLPGLLGDAAIIKHINYDENPFLSDTARDKAERLKDVDFDAYRHIYLGEPKSDDDKVLIKLSWIEAAVDAHLRLGIQAEGHRQIGYDVADSGEDLCANVAMTGIVCTFAEEWKAAEDELNESCRRTYNNALNMGASINYDSIGVGAHSGSEFKSINESRSHENGYKEIEYTGYNAGGAVREPDKEYAETKRTNAEYFENIKAQDWVRVADRFRNTYNAIHKGHEFEPDDLISISSELPEAVLQKLKIELATPRRDFSKNGKIKVESKSDMAKRDVKSPNLADAFIMANSESDQETTGFAFF